jgi:hypothetical protein
MRGMFCAMPIKAQHDRRYQLIPPLLRNLREQAGFTQRELGRRMRRPQSWIYNCETANRRVDVAEFVVWCRACNSDPQDALKRFIDASR